MKRQLWEISIMLLPCQLWQTSIMMLPLCHRLAFACTGASNKLKFTQKLRTLDDLWAFFNKSPKQLKSYIKVTLEARNFEQSVKKRR